jgi:fluoroacetyl-CoA thioesterase
MDFKIPLNISARRSVIVDETLSARYIGSGEVDVFATPMMIAIMEAAARELVQSYLPEGWTTVGTKVDIEHMRATPIGDTVTAEATLIRTDGRSLEFAVKASDRSGVIGQGSHRRFIIELEKFMGNLRNRK